MRIDSISDQHLRTYLLGELSEPECVELESLYLADSELHERMLVIEGELIEEYVHGELTPAQSGHIRETILCSREGKERLLFAQTLKAAGERRRRSVIARLAPARWELRTKWVFMPTMAGLLAILVAGWLVYWPRPQTPTARTAQLGRPPVVNPPTPVIALLLHPVHRGTAAGNTLRIPPGASTIRLQGEVAVPGAGQFQASLEPVDGGVPLQADHVESSKVQGGVTLVSADFEAQRLTNAAYILRIRRWSVGPRGEEVAAYSLDVLQDGGAAR